MPELPEVETTRRGIAPWIEGQRVGHLVVRERRLRWPVPAGLEARLAGATVRAVDRRAKYLLLRTSAGTALLHLGMSGSLRVFDEAPRPGPHDHYDLVLTSGRCLRFNDPRRFGSLLWTEADPAGHPLLAGLGPEPLADGFDGATLWQSARRRRVAIKHHIMNAGTVVGVGNIYASEALFRARIPPRRPAQRVSRDAAGRLATAIRDVLNDSITAGGTTLRDFHGGDGEPGYFARELRVYGREGEPCLACGTAIRRITQGQRSTYYCPGCQK